VNKNRKLLAIAALTVVTASAALITQTGGSAAGAMTPTVHTAPQQAATPSPSPMPT
jgi:hypothetical protein